MSPDQLMLIPKMCHIFGMGRTANFNLSTQIDHEDLYHQQAPWPPRSRVKVERLRGLSDSCWPISRELTVQEIPKLVGWLPILWSIMRTSFKVQRSSLPGQLMLRSKGYHIFQMGRPTNFRLINAKTENVSPTNFKLDRQFEHVLSNAMTSYKGLWSSVIAGGWEHTMSAAPGGHTTC